MKYKYSDKTPKELSPEELLELTNQITLVEYQRRNDINLLQDSEDAAQEILTYMFEKSAKGKVGIKELQEKSTMPHFINTLHFECRNSINYIMRKKKSRMFLYNTYSLSEPIPINGCSDWNVENTLPDEKDMVDTETNIELDQILSYINDTESDRIIIQYGVGDNRCSFKFSYRRFARLYFDLFKGARLSYKDMKDILYNKKDNRPLEDDEIKRIMNRFKSYMKEENILGGLI